jgi:hypothetical protein
MEPAVRYLRYELTNSATPGTETSHFLDLAKDLSAVNRRLYRQGRTYHIKRITIVSSNTGNQDNRVSFSTVPHSWPAVGGWTRGFKTWNDMNKEATMAMSTDVSGTWSDFKVYMSDDMRTGTTLTPLDNGGNAVSAGEWVYTRLITPDGTTSADEFYLHMLGDHNGAAGARISAGLIRSFGESRATVSDFHPNVPGDVSDDPLVNVFDYGTSIDEVVDRMEVDNDNPPYDTDNYPGDNNNMPKPLVVQDTTLVDGKATVGGFAAMCGLVEIETKSPVPSDVYSILVELAPGNFRGIKADVI